MGKKYIIELEDEANGLFKLTPYEEKKEESKGRWHPAFGRKYWHIVRADAGSYVWDGGSVDKSMMRVGNVFRTREDAEFALERMKVIAQLKEYAEPEDTPWKKIDHYCIAYDHDEKKVDVSMSIYTQVTNIYFKSMGDAWDAIHAVGEERIKKYYFGIK